jgi:hypothetical protein
MKQASRKILAAALAVAAMSCSGIAAAQAVTNVSVVEPTGTIYVTGFPATVGVKLSIDARNPAGNCANDGIAEIKVGATGTEPGNDTRDEILHDDDDPVSLVDEEGNNSTTCPAYYLFDWSVPQPDTYTLDVFVRRGQVEGETDEEVVIELQMVSVEYPAPPSVANAYINNDPNLKALPGRQRGCVISMVAQKHAKLAGTEDGYGPKGGPYDEQKIKDDVVDFFQTCPTK